MAQLLEARPKPKKGRSLPGNYPLGLDQMLPQEEVAEARHCPLCPAIPMCWSLATLLLLRSPTSMFLLLFLLLPLFLFLLLLLLLLLFLFLFLFRFLFLFSFLFLFLFQMPLLVFLQVAGKAL